MTFFLEGKIFVSYNDRVNYYGVIMLKKICKHFIIPVTLGCALIPQSMAQVLNNIIIESQNEMMEKNLDSLLDNYRGKTISLHLLENLLKDLTVLYKTQGYPVVETYYPEQTLKNGVLKVRVDSPKIKEIKIRNHSTVNDSTLYRLFHNTRLLQEQRLNQRKLHGELLKVRDLNVFDMAGYFENSNEDGSAANLNLDIKPKKRLGYQLTYDNFGTKAAGVHRLLGLISTTNLTRHADTAVFYAARTDEGQTSFNLSYKLPVNTRLNEVGVSLGYGFYDLADEYNDLDVKGNMFHAQTFFREPLYRSPMLRLYADLGANYRDMTDRIGSYDLELKRHNYGIFACLGMENYFPKLTLKESLNLAYNKTLSLDKYDVYPTLDYFMVNGAFDARYDFNHLVSLENNLNLQWASDTLDPADKFLVGGATRVKGYESNVASADLGLFDDLKLSMNFSSLPKISTYVNLMQAHVKNTHAAKKESFYSLGLGGNIEYHGFFLETSINTAMGHNKEYAKDKFKFLIRFGYYQE